MTEVVRVSAERESALIRRVLESGGAGSAAAAVQADWLVEADLRGHGSHGLQRLPVLFERMRRGLIDPHAVPRLMWHGSSLGVMEGGRGFGPVVALEAVDAASERAVTAGAAVIAVRDCNHLGLLAAYVERIAARGLIGVILTTSEALVHPWGGSCAMVGTNPIAIGIPTAAEPLILDMATGAVSRGKIIAFARDGLTLPAGWAVDATGAPTTDGRAALEGAISPFGGAKGYGLGLALELLVGVLTDTAFGRDVTGTLDVDTVCNKGDVVICIDPGAVGANDVFVRAAQYLEAVRATPPGPNGGLVRIPGDGARARRACALREHIEVPARLWEEIESLHARLTEEVRT